MSRSSLRHRSLIATVLVAGLVSAGPVSATRPTPDPNASRAFRAVLDACRARPAHEVTSTLQIEIRQGDTVARSEKVTAKIAFARGKRGPEDASGRLEIRDYVCTFKGGTFSAIHTATENQYYEETYEGSPYWTVFSAFQDLPYPHLALFFGEAEEHDVWMQLNLNDTPGLVPTALARETGEKGVLRERIDFTAPNGSFRFWVDPKTRLIERAEHVVTGGHTVQPGTTKTTRYTFAHTVLDAPLPPARFTLDVGARQRVDALIALAPPPTPPAPGAPGAVANALVGQPAPDFVLAMSTDDAIDLAALRGRVVILDFWATWCRPCRDALPILHEVQAWAEAERLPVTFVPINVWEIRDPGQDAPDRRLEAVRRFWREQGFTTPVAMDYTDEVAKAYGVTGIPATFVIRPDGIVHAAPYPDRDTLRASIKEALAVVAPEPEDAPRPR